MDNIYVFDKSTKLGTLLGEVQSEFNMSFVIDGTKDSCKMIVHSWNGTEVEPYSIIYHPKTYSWWIVSHDKVERYQNEQGFLYIHNLTLLGAIELLNARDLTDCGFNQNTYTVYQFINRLFALSNFEYSLNWFADYNFRKQQVKFVKAFENYTLLSALREFLDGYNMAAKLEFGAIYNQNNDTYILDNAILRIIPKTGNSAIVHSIDDFDDTRETKTMDKNSFGSTVVSNAENVISTEHKTFPLVGAIKLSSNEMNITPQNALIRLPSKVFKGNWIKMAFNFNVLITLVRTGFEDEEIVTISYNPYSIASFENLANEMYDAFIAWGQPGYQYYADNSKRLLLANRQKVFNDLNKVGTVTLFDGNKLVPYFGQNNDQQGTIEIEKGENVPYLAKMSYRIGGERVPFVFCDKETKNMLPRTLQGICWERGSNIISGFEFLSSVLPTGGHSISLDNTDWQSQNADIISLILDSDVQVKISVSIFGNDLDIHWKQTSFIIDYVPMTDVKIKVDNTREKKDIQLYNQNGRLTDNVALSKLINSYSKEISSDTITRYMQYYDLNDIPKVGDIIISCNVNYVINNVSLDFMQNENETYYIEAEITMSKYVSTKSLLTNPNTNIRDYGIPQNFNVKRKQLYRDYYELAYQTFNSANQDTPYLESDNVFNFAHTPNAKPNFVGVIKLGYDNLVEGENNWYYQLETTAYMLGKMLYIVLDFNDNNIIGYGSQNVFSGFDVTRIFRDFTDILNTPISYVDENGKVKSIDLLLCTNEQIMNVYYEYQNNNIGSYIWDGSLYNYSVFIPSDVYNACLNNNHEIEINEPDYNKDAIEVPVFEYVCQVDDSEDVLIGDNILTQYEDCIYFYSYVVGDNLTQNNAIDEQTIQGITTPYLGLKISNGATIEYDELDNSKLLHIEISEEQIYNINTSNWTHRNMQSFVQGKDYAIFRHAYNLRTGSDNIDLMFIAKKVPSSHLEQNNTILKLELNYYKLK